MSTTDASRYHLHQRLDEVLGPEEATVLMDHLPPTGWADVARRSDLDHLETVLRLEIAASEMRLRSEIAAGLADVRSEIHREIRDLQVRMYGAFLALASVLIALSLFRG